MMQALDNHFAPKRHAVYKRDVFWSMRPAEDESLDKFMLRAMTQAKLCTFETTDRESHEIAVIDKTMSLAPPELWKKLLVRSHLGLDELTPMVTAHLTINNQNNDMNTGRYGSRITRQFG